MSPEELWSTSVGERPYRVWVGERPQKDGDVYLRWGRSNYAKAAVGKIRDGRGRIMKSRQAQALLEANAKYEELKEGPRAKGRAAPLTLADGVALAFSDTGCFPADPATDRYTRETKKRVLDAVRLLGGGNVRWEEVSPGMIRGIWRKLCREHGDGSGRSKAEKTVTNFLTVAAWLDGEFPGQRFPRGPRHWRAELQAHWKKQGHSADLRQPRHTEEEIGRLLAHRAEADPRLGLALDLAMGLRGGQVVRIMRSGCEQIAGTWKVSVPFVSTRKRAPVLTLSPREADALVAAMEDGYLSDLERAYRSGEVTDYALFPEGKLRKGKATLSRSANPMEQSTLVALLRDLEQAACVEQVPHRGWHGIRRGMADYYARLLREGRITDPNLLDEVQGWVRGSTMRERIYRDQEDEALRSDASKLRDLRPGGGE